MKAVYRFLQGRVIKKYLLPFFFSQNRLLESSQNDSRNGPIPPERSSDNRANGVRRIWFHAASVGELESLWPLILSCAEAQNELVLSILSESAHTSLENLKKILLKQNAKILFCGYSPWEGEWVTALKRLKPDLLVTAKYEAWPDLWMSLKQEGIPLSIVSVRARKSLRIARWFCDVLGDGVPSLILFPCLKSEVEELRELFPNAVIEVAGEPRWDRVYARSRIGNVRAKELIQFYQQARRPWGVIGSAWLEDLKFLEPALASASGTLWVVPHKIDPESILKIEDFLRSLDLYPLRTSELVEAAGSDQGAHQPSHTGLNPLTGLNRHTGLERNTDSRPECILVNEMGFLSELYSVADWAFVGGGFGAGIHSTIEPAIHGIPIAVGPQGTDKFSEVLELSHTGQLKILQNEKELSDWVKDLQPGSSEKKSVWMADAKSRLGATQKILATIEKFGSA